MLIFLTDQIAAAIEGFFWPKIFWDFATKTLDAAVKPFPTLQIINLVMGIWVMAWEWPLSFIAGTAIHRSLEARLAFLPLAALAAVLTYQGTNAALYYLVAMVVEFWAFSEGEVCSDTVNCTRNTETDQIHRLSVPSHGHYQNEAVDLNRHRQFINPSPSYTIQPSARAPAKPVVRGETRGQPFQWGT